MPKLPAVKPRQIIRFLERNGFISDHTSGSHFVFYNPVSRRRAVASAQSRHAEGNSDVVAARSGIHAGRVDRLPGGEVTPGRHPPLATTARSGPPAFTVNGQSK